VRRFRLVTIAVSVGGRVACGEHGTTLHNVRDVNTTFAEHGVRLAVTVEEFVGAAVGTAVPLNAQTLPPSHERVPMLGEKIRDRLRLHGEYGSRRRRVSSPALAQPSLFTLVYAPQPASSQSTDGLQYFAPVSVSVMTRLGGESSGTRPRVVAEAPP
jgi:hypothetical protein